MTHTCHAYKCTTEVPERMFMCRKHWGKLAPRLRAKIWATYVPGQEISKTPSRQYLSAAHEAIQWLAKEECLIDEEDIVPTMQEDTLF